MDEVFAALRELAEKWKQSAKDTRDHASYGGAAIEYTYWQERCAKELLDKIFRLESRSSDAGKS